MALGLLESVATTLAATVAASVSPLKLPGARERLSRATINRFKSGWSLNLAIAIRLDVVLL